MKLKSSAFRRNPSVMNRKPCCPSSLTSFYPLPQLLPVLLLFLVFPILRGTTDDEAAEKITFLPKNEAYTEPVTGALFPAAAPGGYAKNQVSRHLNPVYGTVIRYSNENGACADVYVYSLDTGARPVTQEQMDAHYAEVRKTILDLPEKNGPVSSVSVVEEKMLFQDRPDIRGTLFLMGVGEEETFSALVLFLCKGKIVKLRVSYPTDRTEEKAEANAFIQEIIGIFADAGKKQTPAVNPSAG